MPDLKRCIKCGEMKPATTDEFYVDRQKKDGLRSQCKNCSSEYARRFYAEHRDEKRETNRRQYAANPQKTIERQRRRYAENPEKFRERNRRYWAEHREQHREYGRRYWAEHREEILEKHNRWKVENPEKMRLYQRRYYQANPDKSRESARKRQSRKANLPFCFSSADETRALDYWHGCCAICGRKLRDLFGMIEPHFDHWIALSDPRSDNPGTVPSNILPLCSPCNQSKYNCDPHEWLEQKYGKRRANEILYRIDQYFKWVKS